MADSVTSASQPQSSEPATSGHILARMEEYSEEHPEATSYLISTELEAEELLLAIAATLKHLMRDVKHRDDQAQIKKIGQQYRLAVVQNRALDYIRGLTGDDELEIYGLKITVPRTQ